MPNPVTELEPLPPANGNLASHFKTHIFSCLEQNRKQLEPRWEKNHLAYAREPGAKNDDDPNKWRTAENLKTWQSDTVWDIVKQKCVTAVMITRDVMFKGGRAAFMVQPDIIGNEASEISETPDEQEKTTQEQEQLIHRQLADCDFKSELTRAIQSGAQYAPMILKRVVKSFPRLRYVEVQPGVWQAETVNEDHLAVEFKNVWNMYWDLETKDPRDGLGFAEYEPLADWDIEALRDHPLAVPRAIDHLLRKCGDRSDTSADGADGTASDTDSPARRKLTKRLRKRKAYHFWGRLALAEALKFERETAGDELPGEEESEEATAGKYVRVFIMVVDDIIALYSRVEREDIPYHMRYWEEDQDQLGGVSVADNVIQHQKSMTGIVRALEDNAKQVSNLIAAVKRQYIKTDLNAWEPGMLIELDEECDDARKAIQQIQFVDSIAPLLKALETFLVFADHSSMLPRSEQGQQADHQQTAFELAQRLERAGKYLGAVIQNIDAIVEEVVTEFYKWNMGDPNITVGRGSFRVKALGFTSFENRITRLQNLLQLLNIAVSKDEILSIVKLRWIVEEIVKALDLDSDQVVKTPAEMTAEADQREAQLTANLQSEGGSNLAYERELAEIARLRAEANLKDVTAEAKRQEVVIKKAETVHRLTTKPAKPPVTVAA